MVRAVVDANVIFADRNSRDEDHDQAAAIMDAVDRGDLPTIHLTTHNMMEALASIQKRSEWARAVETLQYLEGSPHIEIVHTSDADQTDGRLIFAREQNVEPPDAVTVAYLNRTGIEYIYSFDDDFDRFPSFARLNTAVNPYA
ncbi:type II toxin-antitoxin system VapC family toxin [Halarchaeum salinum]|uniref:PIN domain-containing protein n=1 Tax=Halarchaeum salinum TaxID=489912 RepID=A0AAV3S5M0_9EURY